MADSLTTLNPSAPHSAVEALVAEAHAAGVSFLQQPDGSLGLLTVENFAFKPELTLAHRAFRLKWQTAAAELSFADVAARIIHGPTASTRNGSPHPHSHRKALPGVGTA